MRVLVVTQHFAPEQNAHSFRWSWLSNAFVSHGLTVDVLTAAWRDESSPVEKPDRLNVHRVRNVFPGTGLAARLMNELCVALKCIMIALRLPRPDVVIVTAPPLGAMAYARPLAWLLRRPLVLEVRDAWPELLDEWRTWSDYGNGPSRDPLRNLVTGVAATMIRPVLRAARRSADLVVTTTKSYASALSTRGLKRVIHIPNSTSRTTPAPERDFDGTLRVLYVGNVGRAQYLATAVRAAAIVKAGGGDMVLRVVGHGAHLTAVKRLARQLEAPVEFTGKVPYEEVEQHYGWADSVLVILRAWASMSMTIPSKLYEAVASGKHVSASIAGESADIVRATEAGHVVPPQDPDELADLWSRLLQDPSLLKRGSLNGWVGRYTDPETLGRQYVDSLRQLAGKAESEWSV